MTFFAARQSYFSEVRYFVPKLLAKVSSDSLDLIEDPELFVPNSSDLFGKKFKKAFLKELKLSKELDSLVREKYHGNANKRKSFRHQPGKGPGSSASAQFWGQRQVQNRYRHGRFLEPRKQTLTGITSNLSPAYVPSLQKGQNLERCNRSVASSRLKIRFFLLRQTGVRLIICLDDLLLMNSSKVGLQQDMATAQNLVENLGFVINLEKPRFQPTQQLEFLGFVVNTLDMTLFQPDCKVESIKSHCSKMLSHHEVLIRELSQLIGKLTGSIQAVFPTPLHYRHLQNLKHQPLARFCLFDATITLSAEAKDNLCWWLAHLNAWNGRALVQPSPDVIIEKDTSRTSWGAVCQGVTTGGLWPLMEKMLHINCLERLASLFVVKSFTKDRLCVHVRLCMDNVSAVAARPDIDCPGGTHPLVLSNLVLALLEWAVKCNIFLSAKQIPGALNVSADWDSCHFLDSSNWRLCPAILHSLMQVQGPCALCLFADRLNAQLTQFYSWRPDPMALATDALLQNWAVGRLYAFPPLLPHNVLSCKTERAEGQTHLGDSGLANTGLVAESTGDVGLSSNSFTLGSQVTPGPQGQLHPLVTNQTLQLATWHVCNDLCSRKAFLATLRNSSWQLGGLVQTQFIIPPGKNGIAGVSQGKLIHFAPLLPLYRVLSSLIC